MTHVAYVEVAASIQYDLILPITQHVGDDTSLVPSDLPDGGLVFGS